MPELKVMARSTPGPSGYLRDTAVGVRRADARVCSSQVLTLMSATSGMVTSVRFARIPHNG